MKISELTQKVRSSSAFNLCSLCTPPPAEQTNFIKNKSVFSIPRVVHESETGKSPHFTRRIAADTGKTPNQYTTEARIMIGRLKTGGTSYLLSEFLEHW